MSQLKQVIFTNPQQYLEKRDNSHSYLEKTHKTQDLSSYDIEEPYKNISELKMLQLKRAVRVWTLLKNAFGGWVHAYGKDLVENKSWYSALMTKTEEQLMRGYQKCSMLESNYPPTLGMFNYLSIMGDVPKKYELYQKVRNNDLNCKYAHWIKKNIVTAFYSSHSEMIAFNIFDEAYNSLYEYMQENIDVPDIKRENNYISDASEIEKNNEESLEKAQKEISLLKGYLDSLDNRTSSRQKE